MVWTAEEEELLFQAARNMPEHRPGVLFFRAQSVLPPHRQRTKFSATLQARLNKEFKEWRNRQHPQPPAPAREVPAPQTSDLPDFIVIEKRVVVKEEPDYGRIPTSTLARILLERLGLMDQFDQRFREMETMIAAKNHAEKTHDLRLGPAPPPKEEPKRERIRILVVGPLDSQMREIEERVVSVPKPIELKFYDKDRSANRNVGIVDYAILTRHINHDWWDKMKNLLPNDRVFFVEGGIQPVVQKIYDITSRNDA